MHHEDNDVDQFIKWCCKKYLSILGYFLQNDWENNLLWPRGSPPTLNVEVNIPNGNAPIPNDIWKPPSPNPNPWNPCAGSGSTRWPAGLGGTFDLWKIKKVIVSI